MSEQNNNEQGFGDEQSPEVEFRKLYVKLRSKIHPDRFPAAVYGEEANRQVSEYTYRLSDIEDGKWRHNGHIETLSNSEEKLERLRLLEEEIRLFTIEKNKEAGLGDVSGQEEQENDEEVDASGETKKREKANEEMDAEKEAEKQEETKKQPGANSRQKKSNEQSEEDNEQKGEYKTEKEYREYLKQRGDLNRRHGDDEEVAFGFKKYHVNIDMVDVLIFDYAEQEPFTWRITREKFEELIELMKKPQGQRGSLEEMLILKNKKRKKKPEKETEKKKPEKKEEVSEEEKEAPKQDSKKGDPEKETKKEPENGTGEAKSKDKTQKEEKKSQQEKQKTEQKKEKGGKKEKENSFDLGSGAELEKLEDLEEAVRLTRRDYTVNDLKVNSIYAKISRVLGRVFNKSQENSDTKEYYQRYNKALSDLKEYRLEALRKKYADLDALPEKEKLAKSEELKKDFDDLVGYFNYDEKLNLFDARTNARAEARKDKFGEKILKKGAEVVKWYRELDWKKKLAFSVLLVAGGAGASLLATAGISGAAGLGAFVGGLTMAQRGFSGIVTGAGVVGMQETVSRSMDKRKAVKKRAKALEAVLGEKSKAKTLRSKLKEVNSLLDKELGGYEKAFKRERRKIVSRHLVGIGAGALVGSGAVAWMMRAGFVEAGSYFPGKEEIIEKSGAMKDALMAKGEEALEKGVVLKDTLLAKGEKVFDASMEKISTEAERTGVKGFAENVTGFFMDGEMGGNVPPDSGGGGSVPENPAPKMAYTVPDDISGGKPEGVGGGSGVVQSFSTSEKIADQIIENKHEIIETKVAAGLVDIEIKKDDSIERVIIRRLTDPDGANLPKAEAGKVANLMAREYAREHNIPYEELHLIHPGDHLKLTLDGQKILNFERLSEMRKGVVDSVVSGNAPIASGTGDLTNGLADSQGGSASNMNTPDVAAEAPQTSGAEMEKAGAEAVPVEEPLQVNGVISESGLFSASEIVNISEMPDYAQKYGEQFVRLRQLEIDMGKGIQVIDGNELPKVFGKAYQSLCSSLTQDLFEKDGVLEYEPYQLRSIEAEIFLQQEDNEKITKIAEYVAQRFGEDEVRPRVNSSGYKENIMEWSQRIIGKMIESGGIKL